MPYTPTTWVNDVTAINATRMNNIETGIDTVDQALTDHLADTTDAHDASAISVADSGGNFTGTEVETVLEEIFDAVAGVTGGPFDAYAILSHQETSGTGAGATTASSWVTRPLNTEVDPSGFVTLSSNQFTLAAGSYMLTASAPGWKNGSLGRHKLRVRNITDTTTAIVGAGGLNQSGGADATVLLTGRLTIAGSKTFELQHWSDQSQATDGLGNAMSSGEVEVYAVVTIWRES